MKKSDFYTVVDSMLSQDELIPENIKIQALNNIRNKIDELERRTLDQIILNSLGSVARVVEDAYHISLYRFQFQLLTNVMNKELKTIEETIDYAGEAV